MNDMYKTMKLEDMRQQRGIIGGWWVVIHSLSMNCAQNALAKWGKLLVDVISGAAGELSKG
eukprot:6491457-Amphidinium_carterae.3